MSDETYNTHQLGNVLSAVREIRHPKQIGPYQILEVLGEGGMGTVYRAQQREPINRTVAIKIIKLGMDTAEVIARFESERQALALMSHSNVAKVLDAGATESGRPYFVMEFVKGEPITAYADRNRLTVSQRLELFTQACDAVQHAHHKAIIHRDLKPSNILVTEEEGKAVVKVIDFGVAKALSQRLTDKTLFTTTGQLVGTPEYMSPEQAESNLPDVDTRSDVYSLGVVLYELLSGTLPFDAQTLRSAGYNEIQRIIREVDPPRPSTRLTGLGANAAEVARRRNVELDSLRQQLKSELEWIPLKAMRKERAARYASPTELAEDIENYLKNRPLRAGPESAMYRARKFFRRNKSGVAASAAMLVLLIAGIITTTWQAIRANRERAEAVRAKDNLQEVNNFLTEDLLASAAPEVSLGKELTVREAVDRAADTVATRFAGRPIVEATVRYTLADTYDALGYTERGLPHAQAAYELFRRAQGADHEETLVAAHQYGKLLLMVNRVDDAERLLRDVYARSTRSLGPDARVTVGTKGTLARVARAQGRLDEALQLNLEVLEGHKKLFGYESEQVAMSMGNLAVMYASKGQFADAERLAAEALKIRQKLLPPEHPDVLLNQTNLARLYEEQGKLREAEQLHRAVLAQKRRVLKDEHPGTASSMLSLATVLTELNEFAEAESLTREALGHHMRISGADDPKTLLAANNLGVILNMQNKCAEAEPVFRDVVERRRRVIGEFHPYTVSSTFGLLRSLYTQEKGAECDPWIAELRKPEAFKELSPEQKGTVLAHAGKRLVEQKKFADAEPVLLDALKVLREIKSGDRAAPRLALGTLADVYERTNRSEQAAEVRRELVSIPATKPS